MVEKLLNVIVKNRILKAKKSMESIYFFAFDAN